MAISKQAGRLLALTAIIFVVLLGELPGSTLYWRELQNSGHTFLFALVAILILVFLQTSSERLLREPIKSYAVACGISLLLAVLTELAQLLMNSDASVTDVLRDAGGIIAGLGFYSAYDAIIQRDGINAKKHRLGIKVLSICVLAASLAPLANLTTAYLQRGSAFPVILDLKANWVKAFLQLNNAHVTQDPKSGLMNVTLSSATFPGLSVIEPYPDWSMLEILSMTVVSQQAESFNLVLRIHDASHNNEYRDRFNKKLLVRPGINNYKIQLQEVKRAPQGREMDMKQISDITLFAAKVKSSLTFSLGVMSLE